MPIRILIIIIITLIASLPSGASGQRSRGTEAPRWQDLRAGQTLVVRDSFGVPHIYARNLRGLMYGEGWAQAEDHAVLLVDRYLEATGRLSELRADTPENRSRDVLARTLRAYAVAVESYEALAPEIRAGLESFADGVNDFLTAHPDLDVPRDYSVSATTSSRGAATRSCSANSPVPSEMSSARFPTSTPV